MKTCSKCKLEKPEGAFFLRGNAGKRQAACRECLLAQQKAYREENREKIAAYKKDYCAENQEKIAAYRKNYYAENREEIVANKKIYFAKNREKILAKFKVYRYGVTPEAFERMFAEQGGVCAICGGLGGKKGLCVDHDHETGKVRGLLCGFCNNGIGHFKDSSAIAQVAANYLKTNGK